MESPSLLTSGNDLILWQEEAVPALISELHGKGVLDLSAAMGPIKGQARGNVEDARDTTNLISLAMNCIKGIISLDRKIRT